VSEPNAVAETAEEVVPGIWHWHLADDRIGGYISSAHAVHGEDGVVLIDPLPLAAKPFAGLGDVAAICLTTSSHQRSAWRLRRELGVRVWAPSGLKEADEEPDETYEEGDSLPGGLQPVFSPGPGTRQHSLLLDRGGGALFTSDLFVNAADGVALVPVEYMHDPEEARRTAGRLLDLDFTVLCTGHGLPITDDPKAAIRAALDDGS
jgi:glyoxylase-like metal-dependent hydrolase (beta-lactamase superfamily II)